MKHLVTFAAAVFLTACASTPPPPPDPDHVAVARLALGHFGRKPDTDLIFAGPEIGPKARAALASLGRTVIGPDAIARNEYPPPRLGYDVVRKFDVAEEDARLEISQVDIQNSKEGVIVGTCGVGSDVVLSRKSGAWTVVRATLNICGHGHRYERRP